MKTDENGWCESDRIYVAQCLGRDPKGVIGVAARDQAGRPSVIVNQPLMREGQRWLPFPTLYWLVDPTLSSILADLERRGGVREIEQALRDDPALLQQHLEDSKRYAAKRWALMTEADQATAQEKGLVKVLRDSGIGGVANHEAVKCLHTQFAYHLAQGSAGTTVGRLVEPRFAT